MSQSNFTSVNHLLDEHQKKRHDASLQYAGGGKEGEPVHIAQDNAPNEHGGLTEREPQLKNREVQSYVSIEKHEPTLDPRLIKAGLSTIDSVSLDPRQIKHMPISDEEIIKGLDMPIHSSWRWFSVFLMYLLKKAHIALKVVHGHVVRILIRG